jgi:hypothetical protein
MAVALWDAPKSSKIIATIKSVRHGYINPNRIAKYCDVVVVDIFTMSPTWYVDALSTVIDSWPDDVSRLHSRRALHPVHSDMLLTTISIESVVVATIVPIC